MDEPTGARSLDGLAVGIDGRNLSLSAGTGVATYARVLAETLATLGARPELILAQPPGAAPSPGSRLRRWARAASHASLRAEPLPPGAGDGPTVGPFGRVRVVEDVFRVARVHFDVYRRLLPLASLDPPAVMHWTYPMPLRFRQAINLYTIHDLIPLDESVPTDTPRAWHRRLLTRIVRSADHIVTVSESARRDIIRELGCPEDKVTNTYQVSGLPDALLDRPAPTVAAEIAAAVGLPIGGYFLFVGSIEPRKNLRGLIEAHRASGAVRPLVVVGPPGWRAADELAPAGDRLVRLEAGATPPPLAAGAVVRLDHVPIQTLVSLLTGARALLFPSLAEGFGLPIVEAMTVGTPVMTAQGGATGEVAAEAACLVDARDGPAMATAIAALDRDDGLCGRLAAAGRVRARAFSRDAYARRLAALYAGLVRSARG